MKNKIPEKRVTKDNADELHEVLFAPYVKQLDIHHLTVTRVDNIRVRDYFWRATAYINNSPILSNFVSKPICIR